MPDVVGFKGRIEALALAEVDRVLADAADLGLRAEEVQGVLASLGLEVPEHARGLIEELAATVREPSGSPVVTPRPTVPSREVRPEPEPPVEVSVEPAAKTPSASSRGTAPSPVDARRELEDAVRAAMTKRVGVRIQVPDIIGEVNLAVSTDVVTSPEVKAVLERFAAAGEVRKEGEGADAGYLHPTPPGEKPVSTPQTLPPVPRPKRPMPRARRSPRVTAGEREEGERTYTTSEGVTRRSPVMPGIEAVPEELRKYPAGQSGGPVPQRLASARLQQTIHQVVIDEPRTATEVAQVLEIQQARASDHLRDMGKVGLVRLTGESRDGAPVYGEGDGTPIPGGFPPELAVMPVATGPFTSSRYTVALQQLRVLNTVQKMNRPVVNSEVAELIADMPRSRITEYLNVLADQGRFLERTGKYRRAKGQTAGRTAVEYVVVKHERPTPREPESRHSVPTPPDAGSTDDAPHAHTPKFTSQELVNEVRAAMVKREGKEFAAHDICEDINGSHVEQVTTLEVERVLSSLVGVGALKERTRPSNGGRTPIHRYLYERVTDPGAAAKIDAQRRRAERRNNHSAASAPVPGTGRGMRASNAEVQAAISAAEKAEGWEVQKSGGDHFAFRHASLVTPIYISATPGTSVPYKDIARLRKAGLAV